MNICPCGSQKSFSDCCEPYLNGTAKAQTPEKLMRSRYTAYSLARIDYIQKTMCKKAAEHYDPQSAKIWASSVKWLGLTVIKAPKAVGNAGTVTFSARFQEQGINRSIDEKSLFEKINGEWFYTGN